MALPPLREELALLPGPTLGDGQPCWTLHDPSRNRFFSLDWPTLEILQRWSLDDAEAIVAEIGGATTLQLEVEDVERVARFLVDNQLTQPPSNGARQYAGRLATLEWGKDVDKVMRWSDQHLLRIERLEADATCPHIVSSDEGTSYCALAEQTATSQPDPQGTTFEDALANQERTDG